MLFPFISSGCTLNCNDTNYIPRPGLTGNSLRLSGGSKQKQIKMKKVVSPQEVAHLFANKVQSEATNSGRSLYFEDQTIFSYGRHFQIARHVKNSEGREALLFTLRSYSNTTAKHIRIVSTACSHLNIIYVPDPANSKDWNFEQWKRSAEESANRMRSARKPERYILEINEVAAQVDKYASFFGYQVPEDLKAVLSITQKEDAVQYMAKREEFMRLENERKAKVARREYKEALKKWFNFERQTMYDKLHFDFLRLNGSEVETTQGVKLPVSYCKKLYNQISGGKLKPGAKVLHYNVSEITTKELVIGCHRFNIPYLLKFGSLLN